jgi:hypothetical protein
MIDDVNFVFKMRVVLVQKLIAVLVWIPGVYASSWFVSNYESLASYGNLNAYGNIVYQQTNKIGIFNGGPIEWAGLAVVLFSAAMFTRGMLNYIKICRQLRSLIKANTNENDLAKGVNV